MISYRTRFIYLGGLLLALMLAYMLVFSPASPETLAANAFIHYSFNFTSPKADPVLVQETIDVYENKKDYAAAVALFERLAAAEPEVKAYAFYQGAALTGAGKYAEALPVLERVSGETNHPYGPPAIWYLALAQLGAGQKKTARNTLKSYLSSTNPEFRRQAEALLSRID